MPVIGEVLAFPEELVNQLLVWARFVVVGLFFGLSSEDVGETDGGEVRWLALGVGGESEDVGGEERERVLGLLEPVSSERVEIVYGSHREEKEKEKGEREKGFKNRLSVMLQ